MKKLLKKLLRCSRGNVSIEYALIASLIALALAPAFNVVGAQLNSVFTTIGSALSGL